MKSLIVYVLGVSLTLMVSGVRANQTFICQYGEKIREVHVVYKSTDAMVPCSVQYKKSDSTETLWTAEAQEGYCEEKAQSLVNKLEGWRWSCSQPAAGAISSGEVVKGK